MKNLMKKTTCLTVFSDTFDRFKKLCEKRYSNVSQQFHFLMLKELEKEGEKLC